MTLIEALVALAIFGATAVVFLMGLTTSSKAVMISQERVAAESLAKSQMEYIKSQDYDEINDPPQYANLADEDIPDGYDVTSAASRLDPENDGTGDDDGLQEITVSVNHNGDTAHTVVDYKVNR